ncbi:MAG: FecR domain-containing protein [Verrucomicrobiota bacterium]
MSKELRVGEVSRAAAKWLLNLQECELDSPEADEFRAWLGASEEHSLAWNETIELYEAMGELEPSFREEWRTLVSTAKDDAGDVSTSRKRMILFPVYLGVGIAACLCIAFIITQLVPPKADFVTERAELREVQLEDASEITLAPESRIAVDFDGSERRVRLIDGEVYFNVQSDAFRPFIVEAGDLTTRVTGTVFSVRRFKDGASVALQEGEVMVAFDGGPEQRLKPGDSMTFGRGEDRPELETMALEQIGAWSRGQLVLDRRSLEEAIDEIGRYLEADIDSSAMNFGGRKITGIYNLDKPFEALQAAVRAHGADAEQVGDTIFIKPR